MTNYEPMPKTAVNYAIKYKLPLSRHLSNGHYFLNLHGKGEWKAWRYNTPEHNLSLQPTAASAIVLMRGFLKANPEWKETYS